MFMISFIDCFFDDLEQSLPLLDQVFKSYKEHALQMCSQLHKCS